MVDHLIRLQLMEQDMEQVTHQLLVNVVLAVAVQV
jgi:hypothetical protein